MLRHMHGYHGTLINCGARPQGCGGCFAFCVQVLVKLHACQPERISRWFIVPAKLSFSRYFVASRRASGRHKCMPVCMPLHSPAIQLVPLLTRSDIVDRLVFYVPSIQLSPALKYVSSSRPWNLVNWFPSQLRVNIFHEVKFRMTNICD